MRVLGGEEPARHEYFRGSSRCLRRETASWHDMRGKRHQGIGEVMEGIGKKKEKNTTNKRKEEREN